MINSEITALLNGEYLEMLCLFPWINVTYFHIKELSKLGQISRSNSLASQADSFI